MQINESPRERLTPVQFRLLLQAAFTLFNIYVGIRFAAFLSWALGKSEVFVAKPGAVEGFLPISALLGLRQWLATAEWDPVHPAGLTIFLAILTMAFLFRKGFCAYICPVGFISNLIDRAGRRLKLSRVPRPWADYPLTGIKYLGVGFFSYTVFISMDLRSVQSFLTGPYNMVADAKMMAFFTDPSTTSLIVVTAIVLLSLVIRNAWCRYLCPYGALLGLFSWLSPTAVTRDEERCIGCGKCTKGCPGAIKVEEKKIVRSPECIGCMECVGHCPVDDCLTVKAAGRFRVHWLTVGICSVAVLLLFWGWAKLTGHWDSEMPPFMFKRMYSMFLGAV
ncbi:MAG: 4Fe-4S ferredoxin [Desulfovibrio sp.]|nr:4Fe-4S ferredoxin [Desulfovibrio sp.]|tara:strand:- start:18230 stop:19234 length:1005 start_codon:yes stop_codon:yes gene_type:complete